MEIKEAIEVLKNEQLDIFDGRYGKAFKVVREALRNGYTLCKVNEALEKMEGKKFLDLAKTDIHCGYDGGLSTAIEILKEACK